MYKKKTRRYPQARPGTYRPDFALYERLKYEWITANPGAPAEVRDEAIRAIARQCGI